MRSPFWTSAAVLLNYKRQISLAIFGALVSAVCFGGGLTMVLPVLQLLLRDKQSLQELIGSSMTGADRPALVQATGQWLAAHVPADPFSAFLMVLAGVLVLTLVGSGGRYLHQLLTLTVVARAVMVWRARLFDKLIRAGVGELLTEGIADHISRVVSDARVVGRGYQAIFGKALAKIMNGVAALSLALWLDWRLTLIALIGAPVNTILLRKFGKRIRRASKRLMAKRARMYAALQESLSGIRVVKVHHAEGYERRRFMRINRELYREEMKLRQARALSGPVIETLGLIGVLIVAGIAGWYIFNRDVPPERFMTVMIALMGAAAALKPLTTLHNQYHEADAAAERVLRALEITTEPRAAEAAERGRPLARHRRGVRFENVSFTYPNKPEPVLHGVSLEAEFGQTVAVVGSNGSGKTTLLSMLPRLLDPVSGRVMIDGTDIASVSLRSLRSQIAVVTQQTVLFEGTVAENIAYGRGHTGMDQIVAAAKAAYADGFISELPDGYQTVLGEGGVGLSGGQAQRVCIARAVLRDPAILVLDEATSQIDAESEAKINRALNELRHGRTTFIIAHRLSTVIDADQIVVLEDGRVVDRGLHAELLGRCAAYQTLTRTQLQPEVRAQGVDGSPLAKASASPARPA